MKVQRQDCKILRQCYRWNEYGVTINSKAIKLPLAAVKFADIAKSFKGLDPYTEKKIPVEAQRRPWHNAFCQHLNTMAIVRNLRPLLSLLC